MFSWFRSLNASEARAFYACYGGWAVDALDTQIYSFLIPVLIATWHITRGQAGLLGTSALISSALGGWIAGMLCDRLGRVLVMKLAIAWFVVFTILCGFANSYDQLMVARVLSGLGFGGEWAAGSVLIGEIIRPQYRGKAVGTVQSAYSIGYAVAAIMSSILFTLLPPQQGWRVMFWLGVVPAVFVYIALRKVKDPEVYLSARKAREANGAAHVNPLMIFHPSVLKITILTALLALGVQAGGYALTLWLPTFLKTVRGFTPAEVGYHMFTFTVGSFIGFLVAAYLSDAIGRRLNFLLFAIGNGVMIPAFLYLPIGNDALFVLDAALGFVSFGIYSALGPYFTELFPSAVRASGQGFSYNFGRGVGAFFPAIVGLLSSAGGMMSLRNALAVAGTGGYVFVLVAIAFLPETRGRDLTLSPDLVPETGPGPRAAAVRKSQR